MNIAHCQHCKTQLNDSDEHGSKLCIPCLKSGVKLELQVEIGKWYFLNDSIWGCCDQLAERGDYVRVDGVHNEYPELYRVFVHREFPYKGTHIYAPKEKLVDFFEWLHSDINKFKVLTDENGKVTVTDCGVPVDIEGKSVAELIRLGYDARHKHWYGNCERKHDEFKMSLNVKN